MKFFKIIVILFIALIPIKTTLAQTNRIDSLKTILKSPTDDTVKYVIYNQLSNAYRKNNPDSSIFYANLTLDYFKRNKHYLGLGDSYRCIAIANCIKGNLEEAEPNFLLSYKYFKMLNKNLDKYSSMHYTNMNILYSMKSDMPAAILYNDSGMSILQNKTDSTSISTLAKLYLNSSSLQNNIGDFNSAIESNLKAIDLCNSIGEQGKIESMYVNIGNSFGFLKEYDKALEYYYKAKEMSTLNKNNYILFKSMNNIASMYKSKQNYEKAIQTENDLLLILDSLDLEKNKISPYVTLATTYVLSGNRDAANIYFDKLLSLCIKYDDDKIRLPTYLNYAEFLVTGGKIDEGLKYNNLALEIALRLGNYNKLVNIYETASDAYQITGQLDSAIFYMNKYQLLKDSLASTELKENIYNLEKKYQTAEKEKENQKLRFENKLQKQENEKIKIRNLFLISVSILVIILFVIILFVYKTTQKNKFNKLMLNIIDEQNNSIARNLHDGMSGYLHAIKNSLVFKNETSKDLDNEISIINRSQKELRFLMKQLSSPYYKNKKFDLSQELNELNNFYENTSHFKIDSYFDQNIIWKNIAYEDKLQIYKLSQELLANVKKHSGASQINLQFVKDKNNLILSLEDNGKGFNQEDIIYGYGIKNINKRVNELKGKLDIDSKVGQGTFISFTLPVLA